MIHTFSWQFMHMLSISSTIFGSPSSTASADSEVAPLTGLSPLILSCSAFLPMLSK